MSGEPAEYWARLYMKQSWGGKNKMAYRKLLGQINQELQSPMTRCPSCEEPGYPTMLAWPNSTNSPGPHGGERANTHRYRRRYGLCVLCGHKFILHESRNGTKRPGQPHYFSPEECDRIEALWLELELLPRELAKMFHSSEGTIRNVLKRRGHKFKHGGTKEFGRISHQELETIRFLYSQIGWTQKQIADYTGKHPGTISYYCLKLGFKPRARHLKDVAAFDARKLEDLERRKRAHVQAALEATQTSSTATIHLDDQRCEGITAA